MGGVGAVGVAGGYLVVAGLRRRPIGSGRIAVGISLLVLVALAILVIVAGADLGREASH